MRACPICQSNDRRVRIAEYDDPRFALYQCNSCEMLYVDAGTDKPDVDQAWLDGYYLNVYTTSDLPYSDAHLNALAEAVCLRTAGPVLDIGGMDGELQRRIMARGLACGIEGVVPVQDTIRYDAVVLSHTLEHIYDLPAMLERVRSRMGENALLFIECPVWLDENVADPVHYDWHWQHINKLTLSGLERILKSNGFLEIVYSHQIDDYLEYHCGRFIAR